MSTRDWQLVVQVGYWLFCISNALDKEPPGSAASPGWGRKNILHILHIYSQLSLSQKEFRPPTTLLHTNKKGTTLPHTFKRPRHSKMDTHAKIVHKNYVQLCLVSTAKTTPLCRYVAPQAVLWYRHQHNSRNMHTLKKQKNREEWDNHRTSLTR